VITALDKRFTYYLNEMVEPNIYEYWN